MSIPEFEFLLDTDSMSHVRALDLDISMAQIDTTDFDGAVGEDGWLRALLDMYGAPAPDTASLAAFIQWSVSPLAKAWRQRLPHDGLGSPLTCLRRGIAGMIARTGSLALQEALHLGQVVRFLGTAALVLTNRHRGVQLQMRIEIKIIEFILPLHRWLVCAAAAPRPGGIGLGGWLQYSIATATVAAVSDWFVAVAGGGARPAAPAGCIVINDDLVIIITIKYYSHGAGDGAEVVVVRMYRMDFVLEAAVACGVSLHRGEFDKMVKFGVYCATDNAKLVSCVLTDLERGTRTAPFDTASTRLFASGGDQMDLFAAGLRDGTTELLSESRRQPVGMHCSLTGACGTAVPAIVVCEDGAVPGGIESLRLGVPDVHTSEVLDFVDAEAADQEMLLFALAGDDEDDDMEA
eukprot:g8011.t1